MPYPEAAHDVETHCIDGFTVETYISDWATDSSYRAGALLDERVFLHADLEEDDASWYKVTWGADTDQEAFLDQVTFRDGTTGDTGLGLNPAVTVVDTAADESWDGRYTEFAYPSLFDEVDAPPADPGILELRAGTTSADTPGDYYLRGWSQYNTVNNDPSLYEQHIRFDTASNDISSLSPAPIRDSTDVAETRIDAALQAVDQRLAEAASTAHI